MRRDMAAGLLRDPQVKHRFLPWLLWAATSCAIVWLTSRGKFNELATLVAVAYFGAFLLRWPIVGVALLIIDLAGQRHSTYLLSFIPGYRLGFITIYFRDVVLAFTLLASIRSFVHRQEKPLFLTPLMILSSVALISSLVGMIAGNVTADSFMNGVRGLFLTYAIYFAAAGVLDTRKKLHAVLWVLVLIAIYGIYGQFQQLISPAHGGPLVDVVGRPVPRIRAGVHYLIVLTAFLCVAQVAEGRRVRFFLPLAIATVAYVLFTLIRQDYVMLATGLVTLLLPGFKGRMQRVSGIVLTIIGLLIVLTAASPFTQIVLGDTAISTILDRASTILKGAADPNVAGRVSLIREQLHAWLGAPSPLLGYGFATQRGDLLTTDTGIPNTLVLLGVFGVLAVLILWIVVTRTAYRLYDSLAPSVERGYVLGTFCFWVAMLVSYLVVQDFFTRPTIEVVLAMTIVDRIEAFARQGLIPVRQNLS